MCRPVLHHKNIRSELHVLMRSSCLCLAFSWWHHGQSSVAGNDNCSTIHRIRPVPVCLVICQRGADRCIPRNQRSSHPAVLQSDPAHCIRGNITHRRKERICHPRSWWNWPRKSRWSRPRHLYHLNHEDLFLHRIWCIIPGRCKKISWIILINALTEE